MSVVDLGPHDHMTPEQAIGYVMREGGWESIIICGWKHGSDELHVRSSHMPRENALWLVEHLKLHVLDRL